MLLVPVTIAWGRALRAVGAVMGGGGSSAPAEQAAEQPAVSDSTLPISAAVPELYVLDHTALVRGNRCYALDGYSGMETLSPHTLFGHQLSEYWGSCEYPQVKCHAYAHRLRWRCWVVEWQDSIFRLKYAITVLL